MSESAAIGQALFDHCVHCRCNLGMAVEAKNVEAIRHWSEKLRKAKEERAKHLATWLGGEASWYEDL